MMAITFHEHHRVHADGSRTQAGSHFRIRIADEDHIIPLAACDRRVLALDYVIVEIASMIDPEIGWENIENKTASGSVNLIGPAGMVTLDMVRPPIDSVIQEALTVLGIDTKITRGDPLLIGHGIPAAPIHITFRDWMVDDWTREPHLQHGTTLDIRINGSTVLEKREIKNLHPTDLCRLVLRSIDHADAARLRTRRWQWESADGEVFRSGMILTLSLKSDMSSTHEIGDFGPAGVVDLVLRKAGIEARVDDYHVSGTPNFRCGSSHINLYLSAELAESRYGRGSPVD